MVPGDQAFFYHTGDERRIMGVVEILRAALPDPKDAKGKMVLVRVKPIAQLHQPVTLSALNRMIFSKILPWCGNRVCRLCWCRRPR